MSPRVKARESRPLRTDAYRYGADSENSYYRDLVLKTESDERRRASYANPILRGADPGDPQPASRIMHGTDVETIAKRLNLARWNPASGTQKFALDAATDTALIPTSQLPRPLAEKFEVAARNHAVVANMLGSNPIPADTGMTVSIARLESGASVAIQATENTGVSNVDPVFGLPENSIGYAAGYVDVSRQLLDRAGAGTAGRLDAVISAELGRAAGEALDTQILNGTGSSGQTLGLLSAEDIVSETYTSAAPTVAEHASRIGANYAAVAAAYGQPPDTLILHPRRAAFLASQEIAGEDQPARILRLYGRVIEAPTMPTTLSTNQDAVLSVNSNAVHIFSDSEITSHADPGSGTLTVRFRVLVRVAVVVPLGEALGKITGTGLTTPTFA